MLLLFVLLRLTLVSSLIHPGPCGESHTVRRHATQLRVSYAHLVQRSPCPRRPYGTVRKARVITLRMLPSYSHPCFMPPFIPLHTSLYHKLTRRHTSRLRTDTRLRPNNNIQRQLQSVAHIFTGPHTGPTRGVSPTCTSSRFASSNLDGEQT